MSIEPSTAGSTFETAALDHVDVDGGPLGQLPWVSSRQARLESRLARLERGQGIGRALGWLEDAVGTDLGIDRPEVLWRTSALGRTGMVAQLVWPRLATRLAVGLETPLAHAFVDRLLGFDRDPAEGRLQITPVEWGVLSFVVAETLHRLAAEPGPLGPWDLIIDRVGPDAFDSTGLGRVVTIRWPVRLGRTEGSLRLWSTEALVARWLIAEPPKPQADEHLTAALWETLAGDWRCEAGTISLARGLRSLRTGGVLPLSNAQLRGSPQDLAGTVELALSGGATDGRFWFAASPVSLSGGGRLTIASTLSHEFKPREPIAVTPSASADPAGSASTDVPVTLIVELGRVSLTLRRLADLKPGDVVTLGRHSREPVELTSGGRLVARGELVQIDTELGVRVTHVLL
jgi:type III secretion system YscQ/HrcQ family protein